MARFLKNASSFLMTKNCADKYFDQFDFLDMECFKSTISKCLGMANIFGAVFVKVPQIVKIVNSGSVKGINLVSVLLDLYAVTAMSSYSYAMGYAFTAWGEGLFLSFQTLVIALLVLYDNKHTVKTSAFLIAYISIVLSVVTDITPKNLLWTCQTLTIPVTVIGKMIQAYTNYSKGGTGQLSAITCFLLFIGSLSRIFTSIQETGDKTIITMYTCSTLANGIIAFQILYYWNVHKKSTKDYKDK